MDTPDPTPLPMDGLPPSEQHIDAPKRGKNDDAAASRRHRTEQDTRVEDLTQQVSVLTGENVRMELVLADAAARIEELEQAAQAAATENAGLGRKAGQLRARLEDVTASNADQLARADENAEERLQQAAAAWAAEKARFVEERDRLLAENAPLAEERDRLLAENAEFVRLRSLVIEETRSAASLAAHTIAGLEAQNEELAARNAELVVQNRVMIADQANIMARHAQLVDEKATALGRASDAEKEVAALKRQLPKPSAKPMLRADDAPKRQRDSAPDEPAAARQQAGAVPLEQTTALATANATVARLEIEKTNLTAAIDGLNQQLRARADAPAPGQAAALEQAQADLRRLRFEKNALATAVEDQDAQLEVLRRQVREAEESNEDLERRNAELARRSSMDVDRRPAARPVDVDDDLPTGTIAPYEPPTGTIAPAQQPAGTVAPAQDDGASRVAALIDRIERTRDQLVALITAAPDPLNAWLVERGGRLRFIRLAASEGAHIPQPPSVFDTVLAPYRMRVTHAYLRTELQIANAVYARLAADQTKRAFLLSLRKSELYTMVQADKTRALGSPVADAGAAAMWTAVTAIPA